MTGKEFIDGSRRIMAAAPTPVEFATGAARVFRLFSQISTLADKVRADLRPCPTCAANAWSYLGVSYGRMEFLCDGCGLKLNTADADKYIEGGQ